MSDFKARLDEYLHSSAHLGKKHVHPRMIKMFEAGGMTAVFARGQGQYLYDGNDNRYLDLLSGGGVYFMGRNQPEINDTLRQVLELDLPNLTLANASLLGGLLAEKLIEKAGPHFGKVIYANTGTETAEVCIRFARYVTRRRRFLYLDNAFHGRTYGAISLCGSQALKAGTHPMMPTTTPIAPNDLKQLRRELRYGDVAAFFVEPVQGMTCTVMEAEYLREAEALCREYGTLFICDEVQTGLARTGDWFRSTGVGARPDMLSVSKTLSGGQVPVSAVLISDEVYNKVYEKFQSGPFYFSTFAENNLAMAAAIATIEFLEAHDAPNRALEIEKLVRDGVAELASRYDVIDRVEGRGCMLAIYFKDSANLRLKAEQAILKSADSAAFAAAVNVELYNKHRIVVQIPGVGANAIKILPPVVTTDEDIADFLNALDETLGAMYKGRGPAMALGQTSVEAAIRQFRDVVPDSILPSFLKSAPASDEAQKKTT